MAYVYGGTIHDASEPDISYGADGFDPSKCGTYAGWRQHQKRGVPLCQPCRDACNAYSRDYYRRTRKPAAERTPGTYTPGVCGDHNGYERHRRAHTTPCQPCRTGHAKYSAQRKAIRAQEKAEREAAELLAAEC